jgi:hypothetical protein
LKQIIMQGTSQPLTRTVRNSQGSPDQATDIEATAAKASGPLIRTTARMELPKEVEMAAMVEPPVSYVMDCA